MKALTVAIVLLAAAPLYAQTASGGGRTVVSINAGVQVTGQDATQSFTLTKNAEAAPISVGLAFKRGLSFDGGATIRLRRQFGLNVALGLYARDIDGEVTARIPHPLYFNQPRIVTGTVPFSRRDTAVHVD